MFYRRSSNFLWQQIFSYTNIYKQQCNYAYAWILKNKLYESTNFCSKPCNLQKLYDSSVSLVGSVLLISNLVCDEISIIGLVHLSPIIWYCPVNSPGLHTTHHGIQISTMIILSLSTHKYTMEGCVIKNNRYEMSF